MASPFKVFRKHQKVMLAGLTILAMFSFVFLGVISDLLGTRQPQNPVVVKTSKYGKLTGQRFSFHAPGPDLRCLQSWQKFIPRHWGSDPQSSHKLIENIFGTASDEDLVNTWLKAQRAEEIGMVISNETINDFLQSISSAQTNRC